MTQKFVSAVAMIMSFKVLKYFSSGKISFFPLASLEISNQKNWSFLSEILTHTTEGLIEKEMLFPGFIWFVTGICLIWKLMEYKNVYSLDACIIPTF